jgi:hypothetical protein
MRGPWLALAVLALLALAGWWWLSRRDPPSPPAAPVAAAETAPAPAPAPTLVAPVDESLPPESAGAPAALAAGGEEETPMVGLDLERLRSKLPEHSYWQLQAPTTDPELLRMREARARDLNVLYGKVLSGTGSDEDIRAYFEERRRISEDAVAFASAVIVEMGDDLGERERAMLDLAITLHRERLAELPRRIAEAEERKREQDARREEWLRTGK